MDKEQFLAMQQEQRSSGLTVSEYCQVQSISYSTYNYWRKKYSSTSSTSSTSKASSTTTRKQSTSTKGSTTAAQQSGLVPVQLKSSQSSAVRSGGVLIQLPNGVQVEFADSSDSVAIQMLNTMCMRYV